MTAKRIWYIVLQANCGIIVKDEYDYEPKAFDISYTEEHFSKQFGTAFTAINIYSVLED